MRAKSGFAVSRRRWFWRGFLYNTLRGCARVPALALSFPCILGSLFAFGHGLAFWIAVDWAGGICIDMGGVNKRFAPWSLVLLFVLYWVVKGW